MVGQDLQKDDVLLVGEKADNASQLQIQLFNYEIIVITVK